MLRAYVRRVLHEGIMDPPGLRDLACAHEILSDRAWATVYVKSIAESIVEKSEVARADALVEADAIVSFVEIRKAKQPCLDAWTIYSAAGDGKFTYGTAFAMTPTGKLVPDRMSVSPSARAAWTKQLKKGRKNQPLDDYKHPVTPPEEDDCMLQDPHYGMDERGPLDRAYEASGWEKEMLDKLAREWSEDVLPKRVAKLAGHNLFMKVF